MTSTIDKQPCPCCGDLTIDDELGHFDICDRCGWEDDPIQSADPTRAGGANAVSLLEARRNYAEHGYSDPSLPRDP